MKQLNVASLLTTFVFLQPFHGNTQESTRLEPRTVSVGISTFHGTDEVWQQGSHADSIRRYLEDVTLRSYQQEPNSPLVFQIAIGNYYQVYDWLWDREIQAAIVSAFTATLLEHLNLVEPIAEFGEPGNDGGHCPLMAAQIEGQGVPPLHQYRTFLEELYKAALDDDSDMKTSAAKVREKYDVSFITHFSASGFIAPLLFAKNWLDEKTERVAVRSRFWDGLLEATDFGLVHGSNETRNDLATTWIRFTYSGQTLGQLSQTVDGASSWYAYDPKLPNADGMVLNMETAQGASEESIDCGTITLSIPNDRLVVLKDHLNSIEPSDVFNTNKIWPDKVDVMPRYSFAGVINHKTTHRVHRGPCESSMDSF